MARIPEHEIERLKAEVSVRAAGGSARDQAGAPRSGSDSGCALFMRIMNPSLVITPSKNLWHCLGACGKGGSVIDWVMKCQGVSFRHAVELLRANHPSLAAPGPVVAAEERRRR